MGDEQYPLPPLILLLVSLCSSYCSGLLPGAVIEENIDVGDLVGRRLFVTGEFSLSLTYGQAGMTMVDNNDEAGLRESEWMWNGINIIAGYLIISQGA